MAAGNRLLRHVSRLFPQNRLHYRNHRCSLSHSSVEAMAANVLNGVTYLTQKDAVALDEDLMGPLGFSVDQLMELAGLSVACSVASEYESKSSVLVLAGPGNNGGDGLVAARHLHHFGYPVSICYPKPTKRPLFEGLVVQCNSLKIPFINLETFLNSNMSRFEVVIDALFGFSFKGEPRPPFDGVLQKLCTETGPKLVSVDIPSGWDVEEGDLTGNGLKPDMLVSLTAPKLSARHFKGKHHYLGGRFVPPEINDKYKLELPPYPSTSMCVKLQCT